MTVSTLGNIDCKLWLTSKHVVLHNSLGLPEIQPAFIEIKDNTVSQICRIHTENYLSELGRLKLRPNVEVFNFENYLIAPAWINAHTHLAMNFFRGLAIEDHVAGNLVHDLFFKLESHLNKEDVKAFSCIGAYESLLTGTGMVWDHYYHSQAAAEGIAQAGLCAVVAPTLQDVSGPGVAFCEQSFSETLSIANNARLQSAGIYAAFGPHATDTVSEILWKKIIHAAEKANLPVHAHVAQSPEEYQHIFAMYGKSPMAFLDSVGLFSGNLKSLFAHNIYCSEKDLSLVTANSTLVYCPASQAIFHFPANIGSWENAGVQWCIATDCSASNDAMNVQRELPLIAASVVQEITHSTKYHDFLKSGKKTDVAATNALRTSKHELQDLFSNASFLLQKVWNIPGKIHPNFKAGVLEAGALANLAIWDLDHPNLWPAHSPLRSLAMCDCSPALYQLMCAGKWIGEPGNFQRSILHSPEYKAALNEAKMRLKELRNRARI